MERTKYANHQNHSLVSILVCSRSSLIPHMPCLPTQNDRGVYYILPCRRRPLPPISSCSCCSLPIRRDIGLQHIPRLGRGPFRGPLDPPPPPPPTCPHISSNPERYSTRAQAWRYLKKEHGVRFKTTSLANDDPSRLPKQSSASSAVRS